MCIFLENKTAKLNERYANEEHLPKHIRTIHSFLVKEDGKDVKYYKYQVLSDIREDKADCIEECYDIYKWDLDTMLKID